MRLPWVRAPGQSKYHRRSYGLRNIDAHDERHEAADAEERTGLTRSAPVFQWVMMVAYSIILWFLTLMGVILWRGFRRERTRK